MEQVRVAQNKQTVSVIDVLKVTADQIDAKTAVKTFEIPVEIETRECDIFIAGGSTAGIAAALSAANCNLRICLSEETDWLGGQMTTQGVPITDDGRNFQVETSGSNRSYQDFRNKIREYYKQKYKLSDKAKEQKYFNPGNCWYWVSQLTFEPKVAIEIINQLLNETNNPPQIYLRHIPLKIECADGQINRIITVDLDSGKFLAFKAKYYIDATDLGDLLPLSGAAYSSGVEAKSETGETQAAAKADPEHVQDYTFPFIVEFVPGTNNTITKPALYDYFNKDGKLSLLRYKMFGHGNKIDSYGVIYSELMPFWTYRRLLDKSNFTDENIPHDVAVINWFSNDFRGHNIIDKEPAAIAEYLSKAKQLSLSFLYWLQTEAPRDEGGKGYPEIRLKVDALGTSDGLSKYPYIRESRRGKARTIIKEQDIKTDFGPSSRARLFKDSVGIGFFPIDIHGAEAESGALGPTKRFQIPLGALLLNSPSNLILSCKNIGTTHITNAAYRLHPIEWAIGEAAGQLAAFALKEKVKANEILDDKALLLRLQLDLISAGVPLYWYDDVPTNHPQFVAIQLLAVLDIVRGNSHNLHFQPQANMSNDDALQISQAIKKKYPQLEGKLTQLDSAITRAEFASKLYQILCGTILPSKAQAKV